MALGVVDIFETVEINEQSCQAGVLACCGIDLARQRLLKQAAVRQAGEAVIVGQRQNLCLGALALGDVLRGTGDAEGLAIGIGLGFGFNVHEEFCALRVERAHFDVEFTRTRLEPFRRTIELGCICRMNELEELLRRQRRAAGVKPGHGKADVGGSDCICVEIPFPTAQTGDTLCAR